MKKYVCVLATDDYLDGCLVLNENLKHINSQYRLLCLINEELNEETRKILDYFKIEYKEIRKISYDVDYKGHIQPYFKNTFDKLSIFNLTEYEKIVYLDLDLLILENIDNLFNYDSIAMAKDYPFSNLYNSGVMVIEPNKNDYDNLIELMKEKIKNQIQLGDQDIINEYFKTINIIPQEYNLMRILGKFVKNKNTETWNIRKHPIKEFDDKTLNKKILHYIMTPKPFQTDYPYDEIYSYLYTYYLCIIKEKKLKMKK